MEGKEQTENVIRNIVSEIMRECKAKHIRVSENFIAYYVNLLQLDPSLGLTYEMLKTREKVQNFVSWALKKLGNTNDPKILTLKLQHEFKSYYKELDETVKVFRRKLNNKLYPLLLEIVEQQNQNRGEKLYKKMCYYITLASGLGNPTEKLVFKEVLHALKSIFNPEEINVFPSLQIYIKQELLNSIALIITGIRLYNKACKKGGQGIVDLPGLMKKATVAIGKEFQECINHALDRARQLTKHIEQHMKIGKDIRMEWCIVFDFGSSEEKIRWEFMRDLALAHRQLAKTTKILLEAVANLKQHIQILNEQFNEIIQELDTIIVPTLYTAVTDVFPYFTELAKIWKDFQEDGIRLRELYNIFHTQAEKILSLKLDFAPDFQREEEPLTFDTWLGINDEELNTKTNIPQLKVYSKTEEFKRNDLEYHGYCCWALINTGGVLIPANISLGVIEYKRKIYGFSSRIAANCFTKDPEIYIMRTLNLARKCVHLINYLNLQETLQQYIHIKSLVEKKESAIISRFHKACQTDTHFYESIINYGYTWNVWDHRRTILNQLDVVTKMTKSTETTRTYQKGSRYTQTYTIGQSLTQTKRDNYANTKRPLRFIQGLRGIKANSVSVLNLSEPFSCYMSKKLLNNKF